MKKASQIAFLIVAALVMYSCDNQSTGDDDAETREPSTDESSVRSLPTGVRPLEHPGKLTVTNDSEGSIAITLYAGTYSENESSRVISSKVTIESGESGFQWDITKVQGKNIWLHVPLGDYVLKDISIPIIGSFKDDTDYTLMLMTTDVYFEQGWDIRTGSGECGYDWDLSNYRTVVSSGTRSSLYGDKLIGIEINKIDSPKWSYSDGNAWFSAPTGYSEYSVGLIKLDYTGSECQESLVMQTRLRNSDNTLRVFAGPIGIGKNMVYDDKSTCLAVFGKGDSLRFRYDKNLASYGMDVSDLTDADVIVQSRTTAVFGVPSEFLLVGPFISANSWYYSFTNTTGAGMKYFNGSSFYKDSGNREYCISFNEFYTSDDDGETWKKDDTIDEGQTARLYVPLAYPHPFPESFTPSAVVFQWLPY